MGRAKTGSAMLTPGRLTRQNYMESDRIGAPTEMRQPLTHDFLTPC